MKRSGGGITIVRPRVAVYPGTFDPPTNGHLDIIRRASRIFDQVIVALAVNPEKTPLFTHAERRTLLESLVLPLGNVRVDSFGTMTVAYMKRAKANVILRGIRAISDFEYEFAMALTNRRLSPRVETIFLTASEETTFISSRLIREIVSLGGDVSAFVPSAVLRRIKQRRSK